LLDGFPVQLWLGRDTFGVGAKQLGLSAHRLGTAYAIAQWFAAGALALLCCNGTVDGFLLLPRARAGVGDAYDSSPPFGSISATSVLSGTSMHNVVL
jgi:hypothetical protein